MSGMIDDELKRMRAELDPNYRTPAGEWLRAARRTHVTYLGGLEGDLPEGCVVRALRWGRDDQLLRIDVAARLYRGEFGEMVALLDQWPHLDWEITAEAPPVPEGRGPLVRCDLTATDGRIAITWPDGRPDGARVTVSAEVIEGLVEKVNQC